jgi:hypothetical protein
MQRRSIEASRKDRRQRRCSWRMALVSQSATTPLMQAPSLAGRADACQLNDELQT